MIRRFQTAFGYTRVIVGLVLGLFAGVATSTATPPLRGLLHNEDSTEIFFTRQFPPGKAGEVIDKYVDTMAGAGVTVFLCNTNARRTNYASRVWDSYWDGYDPAGPDDQPFLASVPEKDVKNFRRLIGNMLIVHQQGIDYPARVLHRCRHNGISPWITLRMNDCHYNDIPTHPFHGNFWKKNPQFARQNCTGYYATCLDYAVGEVRDFYKALIVETLERYDIDGLELDFMREPFLFSAGREAEGAPILTNWMRDIRGLLDAAAAKRGHPICLGVRMPSHPETASGLGLDAITWAKEGLIDLLVVTPRWATLEFDMPIAQWRELLGPSKTTLAGGLEILYRPCPGGPCSISSPEIAAGAAVSVLSGGADVVYLFNYFQNIWALPVYQQTLKCMSSLDSLLKLPRTVGVTYRDITAPGENYRAPLPATGKELAFTVNLGPVPDDSRACSVLVGLAPTKAADWPAPTVQVNGKPCQLRQDEVKDALRQLSFSVPAAAVVGTQLQEIKITSKDQNAMTIQRLELSIEGANGGR